MAANRDRLDRALVERGLAETREKAQALIMAGEVLVNGQKASKSGQLVAADTRLETTARLRYVSRGGLKLEAALRDFGIDVNGFVVADFGSSTGGFTDCLLQAGAARVHAIDVGTGQLDWRLRNDPRVVVHEGVNARYLTGDNLAGEAVDLAVCDVSFISATMILPAMVKVLKAGSGRSNRCSGEASVRGRTRSGRQRRHRARPGAPRGGLHEGAPVRGGTGIHNSNHG